MMLIPCPCPTSGGSKHPGWAPRRGDVLRWKDHGGTTKGRTGRRSAGRPRGWAPERELISRRSGDSPAGDTGRAGLAGVRLARRVARKAAPGAPRDAWGPRAPSPPRARQRKAAGRELPEPEKEKGMPKKAEHAGGRGTASGTRASRPRPGASGDPEQRGRNGQAGGRAGGRGAGRRWQAGPRVRPAPPRKPEAARRPKRLCSAVGSALAAPSVGPWGLRAARRPRPRGLRRGRSSCSGC